jgi:Transposase DDE domain
LRTQRRETLAFSARHGPAARHLRPVFLGDDLFACQPIAAAAQQAGGNFIFTCKPSSHQTITEYLTGAEPEEHRQTVVIRGKRTTTIYRWLSAVPMRATEDALNVNWFSIEILNGKGKRTYYNSFVTDLPVTSSTVTELAACGRARWKIENETFNVLKTNGYNLEHNFGHGKETLASVLVTLNLLAFAFHTAARLAVLAWREAVIARGATYRFFEHLRTVTAYVVFETWNHLLRSIAAAAVRPP